MTRCITFLAYIWCHKARWPRREHSISRVNAANISPKMKYQKSRDDSSCLSTLDSCFRHQSIVTVVRTAWEPRTFAHLRVDTRLRTSRANYWRLPVTPVHACSTVRAVLVARVSWITPPRTALRLTWKVRYLCSNSTYSGVGRGQTRSHSETIGAARICTRGCNNCGRNATYVNARSICYIVSIAIYTLNSAKFNLNWINSLLYIQGKKYL